MIDVAPAEVIAAGDVVEFVAMVAVLPVGRQMHDQFEDAERHRDNGRPEQ